MSWSAPTAEETNRRRCFFVERSGSGLLLCSIIAAAGLCLGFLNTTQVACGFVLGVFWARCMVKQWRSNTPGRLSGEFVLLLFLTLGLEQINHYQPPDHTLFLEILSNDMYRGGSDMACTGVTMFLIFWLFRETFLRHLDQSVATPV